MKGGILSVLNDKNEIVAWQFCQSASPAELFEILVGLAKRCGELGVPLPSMIVVNNCCQVETEILKALPNIAICLDVYHFMMRYLAAVLNGTNNPHRTKVAMDIQNAILKNSASKGVLAQYWTKEEQEANIIAVYDKYSSMGVWSAVAHTVHTAQLKHLRKGCLSRPCQDVTSDGSQIEGSHKGWNGLQRANSSGIELQSTLSHDFVLRRNLRIAFAKKPGNGSNLDGFVRSTFGSHHVRLVTHTASIVNAILHTEAVKQKSAIPAQSLRPMLINVPSGKVFGLVQSQHNDTFGGLLTIKSEDLDDDQRLNNVLQNPADPQIILKDLNIDPVLWHEPLKPAPSNEPLVTAPDNVSSANIHSFFNLASRLPPIAPVASNTPVQSGTSTEVSDDLDSGSFLPAPVLIHLQFYLFMKMREELQWKASSMTSKKWAEAVGLYNARLSADVPAKTPRALIDKLGEVERSVLTRIGTNNFKSSNGKDQFWKRHCSAIILVKTEVKNEAAAREVPKNTKTVGYNLS
ncbi:hypothetical protein C8R44DRAFT_835389 [Mycena epipterygia]|nr:hypothetical protein C8R44DRAFT_835389 [Mycena epipterygia]